MICSDELKDKLNVLNLRNLSSVHAGAFDFFILADPEPPAEVLAEIAAEAGPYKCAVTAAAAAAAAAATVANVYIESLPGLLAVL